MKYFISIIILFYFSNVIAQKHDNIWLVGSYDPSSQIEFNSTSFSLDTVNKGGMEGFRAMTSICDSLGNLLFYTNGIWVNNHQHQMMDNGDSLNPGLVADDFRTAGYPTCNSIIILPHPVQMNKYYIFHQSITYPSQIAGFAEHLYYSLIDMNANGGLGRVELKNQILVSDSLSMGQIHAVKHANGRDWWLIQGKGHSIGFYTFLVHENQITLEHEQYIGDTSRIGGGAEWKGQAVFSSQGDKYVRYDYLNDLDIYDFDRCIGLLSNNVHIAIQDSADFNGGVGGVAVSPSGQYLYLASSLDLYQFNLWTTNIESTKDTIAHVDNFYQFIPANRAAFNFLQLAPDGKIYGVAPNTTYMHVIEYPDSAGTASSVLQHHINTNFINGFFMPNHPHYRTPALSGSACDTITNTKTVEITEKEVQIYPNPTSRLVYIEATEGIERLSVHDALGREVYWYHQPRQQGITLDTQQWENGIYYLSIWLDGKIIQEKIQVLR
ncbi:T9SS type A sorting domain-containing protein [Aureispira anguillae]|uniref:T9SS type A sorting domain-containing protein n=1 Tax=Aureispira anguillae TaxID=2864201 RepID=A0A915YCV8_9BACT|nr:T9SS type A sorting domain-containing protein [Aureispira anguillae]BDS10711.1 T9SS type A sorting domain-containing protein [Aureispira anguillae]